MAKPPPTATPADQAKAFNLSSIRRHVFICAGPDCCDPKRGEDAWNYLKRRLAELKLDRAPTHVFRTKCHCLRVCTGGPIAVVHPDNTWYHSADPPVLERILQDHVLNGKPVTDFLLAQNPLG